MTSKTAIVTGGGAGIGLAIALRMAAIGWGVGLIDTKTDKLREAAAKIASMNGSASVATADVADGGAVLSAVDRLSSELCGLDILVNSAGILRLGTIESLSVDAWRETFQTNVDGVFHSVRAAIPYLRARGGGRIINISSWLGKSGKAHYGAYCASKAAIISLTETLALELARDRINVNAICPGIIANTGMRDRAEADARMLGLPSAETRIADVPLGRLGEPSDVAGIAIFLASDAAAYMTGHTVNVTGSLWMS
jgi:NAD(P)-dependent dehydrogenase (short-subunit alcohol dehydrogenase family)